MPTRSTPDFSTRSSVVVVSRCLEMWSLSRRASSTSTPRLAAASHQSCAEHRRGSRGRETSGLVGSFGTVSTLRECIATIACQDGALPSSSARVAWSRNASRSTRARSRPRVARHFP
eukprot:scaffold97444_cov80-Phaeocystis_antarctica.AAC.4